MNNSILEYMSNNLKAILSEREKEIFKNYEEIRVRSNRPLMLYNYSQDTYVTKEGDFSNSCHKAYIVSKEDIFKTIEIMSQNSIYAYSDQIRNGYITIAGGHRVGISGTVVLEKGNIKSMKDYSSLNIRIAKEIIGCSEKLIKYVVNKNSLIVSPPGHGKTTMLRDISRNLSDKYFKKVVVVDERSEISATYMGIPQNNVGMRTDVIDGCPKAEGMIMAVRTLSPHVIITDEIGNKEDMKAIQNVINTGSKIVATIHGSSIEDVRKRKYFKEGIFDRYIFIDNSKGPGTLREVSDAEMGEKIYAG